jgi:biopolymer transport protein ExbB
MSDLFTRGGIMMYPLLVASIVALAVLVERLWMLRKTNIYSGSLLQAIAAIKSEKDVDSMERIAAAQDNVLARLVLFLLNYRQLSRDEQKEIVEEQGRQEIRFLRQRLGIIETIAGIAPLIGLLGTVLGMIRVFTGLNMQGLVKAASLSGGIAEALITTAAGLIIGIPALVVYNYLSAKAETFVLDLEQHLNQLIHNLNLLKRSSQNNEA